MNGEDLESMVQLLDAIHTLWPTAALRTNASEQMRLRLWLRGAAEVLSESVVDEVGELLDELRAIYCSLTGEPPVARLTTRRAYPVFEDPLEDDEIALIRNKITTLEELIFSDTAT